MVITKEPHRAILMVRRNSKSMPRQVPPHPQTITTTAPETVVISRKQRIRTETRPFHYNRRIKKIQEQLNRGRKTRMQEINRHRQPVASPADS